MTVLVFASGLVWAGALVPGVRALSVYEGTPGDAGRGAKSWPANAPALNLSGATLILFVHPECPCSNATMASLNGIMAHGGGKVQAYVVAVLPPGAPNQWMSSSLLKEAAAIPGVRVIVDEGGWLARAFGARTSG